MNTTDITRQFATIYSSGIPMGIYAIERNEDDTAWTVFGDGWSRSHEDAAAALNVYAEMIEKAGADETDEWIAERAERGLCDPRTKFATLADYLAEAAAARTEASELA